MEEQSIIEAGSKLGTQRPRSAKTPPRNSGANLNQSVSVPSKTGGDQNHQFSKAAAYKKELLEAQHRIKILESQNKTSDSRMLEYNKDIKRLRNQCDGYEKEMGIIRKTMEKLQAEKVEQEKTIKTDKDYIKKLEARVTMGTRGTGIAEKYSNLETKVAMLKDKAQSYEMKMRQQEEKLNQQLQEINILTRALELNADKLGFEGEFKTMLLYDVAKHQEQVQVLTQELEQSQQLLSQAEDELAESRTTVDELVYARSENEKTITQLSSEVEELREKLGEFTRETEEGHAEKQVMLNFIEERSTENSSLKAALDHVSNEKKMMQEQYVEEINQCRVHIQELNDELSQLRDDHRNLQTVQQLTEQRLRDETKKSEEYLQRTEELSEREHQLMEEISKLKNELDKLTKDHEKVVNDHYSQQLERESTQSAYSELKTRVEDLSNEIDALKGEKEELNSKLESTVDDLRALLADRDELTARSNEMEEKIEQQMEIIASLEKEKKDLTDSLETTKKSKTLLQKTMLEQIHNVRLKLASSEESNNQLRERITELEKEHSKCEILLKTKVKVGSGADSDANDVMDRSMSNAAAVNTSVQLSSTNHRSSKLTSAPTANSNNVLLSGRSTRLTTVNQGSVKQTGAAPLPVDFSTNAALATIRNSNVNTTSAIIQRLREKAAGALNQQQQRQSALDSSDLNYSINSNSGENVNTSVSPNTSRTENASSGNTTHSNTTVNGSTSNWSSTARFSTRGGANRLQSTSYSQAQPQTTSATVNSGSNQLNTSQTNRERETRVPSNLGYTTSANRSRLQTSTSDDGRRSSLLSISDDGQNMNGERSIIDDQPSERRRQSTYQPMASYYQPQYNNSSVVNKSNVQDATAEQPRYPSQLQSQRQYQSYEAYETMADVSNNNIGNESDFNGQQQSEHEQQSFAYDNGGTYREDQLQADGIDPEDDYAYYEYDDQGQTVYTDAGNYSQQHQQQYPQQRGVRYSQPSLMELANDDAEGYLLE